jgi:hypothetical protein
MTVKQEIQIEAASNLEAGSIAASLAKMANSVNDKKMLVQLANKIAAKPGVVEKNFNLLMKFQ